MAVTPSIKLWLVAIFWLLLIVILTDWLENRCRSKTISSKKQTEQYETIK